MNKNKILYLSRNMKSYVSASYQQDVMDELNMQAQVFFYGLGFNGYEKQDSIDDILNKTPFKPDAIILGHAWLSDKDRTDVDPHRMLQLVKTKIPKVAILNKEYVNLNKKLDYIKKNKFDMVFTHHHDVDKYTRITGIEFIFWPFAFDNKKFKYKAKDKTIDVAFSGVLQNLNKNADQSDIRVEIMKNLFVTKFDVPIYKKSSFNDIEIFWNSTSRKRIGRYISSLLNKHKYLSDRDYANMIQKTKIYINTLSPMGLVSPRFFECMASRALVFCEESVLYKSIFPNDIYVTFKKDLSDFDEKLFYYLEAEEERNLITKKAHHKVQKHHTWEKRITSLLSAINTISKREFIA